MACLPTGRIYLNPKLRLAPSVLGLPPGREQPNDGDEEETGKSRTEQQAQAGEGPEFHQPTVGGPASINVARRRPGGLGHTGGTRHRETKRISEQPWQTETPCEQGSGAVAAGRCAGALGSASTSESGLFPQFRTVVPRSGAHRGVQPPRLIDRRRGVVVTASPARDAPASGRRVHDLGNRADLARSASVRTCVEGRLDVAGRAVARSSGGRAGGRTGWPQADKLFNVSFLPHQRPPQCRRQKEYRANP